MRCVVFLPTSGAGTTPSTPVLCTTRTHTHARTLCFRSPLLPQRCINAMNKSWHPDHFFCSLCGKPFEEDNFNFYEKDGKPYCKEDYFDQFAPTCKRCDRAIMGAYLSAVGSYWHQECFTCKVRRVNRCAVGAV